MKRHFIFSSVIVCTLVAAIALVCLSPFPRQDSIVPEHPDRFAVAKPNLFEEQDRNQCSAFAAAYVLRHYDIEVTGKQVYDKTPYKIPFGPWRGYVLPRGILRVVGAHNLKPTLLTGNISTLKTRLATGVPVIVIVGDGLRWQHYMTLIGYDSSAGEMYFYDSGRKGDTNGDQPGNRTITEEYFLQLWGNGLPLLNHVYIVVEK